MNKTRWINIVLPTITVIILIAVLFSGNNKRKEIGRLTHELEIRVDSLMLLQNRYNQLYQRYDSVFNNLQNTKARFNAFYKSTDSISHTTISAIEKIKFTFQLIKKEQEYFAKIDTTPVIPVFK